MAKIQPSEVSDAFWERVEPLIPAKKRNPGQEYKRKPGAGRKSIDPRRVFEGIVYVLRTGIQWKALPKERFGSPSAIHRYFREWEQAGVFLALWKRGLAEYDDMEGIAWEWQSIDGDMVKAPLALKPVGNNPTDRRGKREQTAPPGGRLWRPALALVVTGANRHDVSQIEAVLDGKMVTPPEDTTIEQNLCAEMESTGRPTQVAIESGGYIPHVVPGGAERKALVDQPGYRARRWVVEVAHSWFNRFRKILVQFEKTTVSYLALLHLESSIIYIPENRNYLWIGSYSFIVFY
ncbi:MAG: IS5 family transposase [Leptospirales bacterium]